MDIRTINPYIRVARPSVLKKGTVIARRIIFDYELIYVESGSFTLWYDDCNYDCHAGEFLFLRPDVPHRFDCSREEISQPHVHFDLFDMPNSKKIPISFKDRPALSHEELLWIQKDVFPTFDHSPVINFADPEEARALLMGVIHEFGERRYLSAKGMLSVLLERLIRDCFPLLLEQNVGNEACVTRQIKDYIDAQHGVGICLDALEKQFSYDKFYLERQFCKEYGKSLIAYSRQKVMEQAALLLREQTVSAVADTLGFSSIYAFSRAFKRYYGISPSLYYDRER